MQVDLGGTTFPDVVFAVVDDLPVPGLLGKPTLAEMHALIDVAAEVAKSGQWLAQVGSSGRGATSRSAGEQSASGTVVLELGEQTLRSSAKAVADSSSRCTGARR